MVSIQNVSSIFNVGYFNSESIGHQSPQPTQNFCKNSEFLSFSFYIADFLSHVGKWVKLIKFEAENEFFLHLEG